MGIRAALLDRPALSGQGIFLKIDEVADESALTERHLPAVKECDLPPGQCVWVPTTNGANPYGGAFWFVSVLERLSPEHRAQLGSV
jgi:hypothetical protein